MPKKIYFILGAVVSVFIAQTAGIVGSFFTVSGVSNWYAFLEKPVFAPPNWVFAPAWITLYTLMGIAAFLVWRRRGESGAKSALCFYLAQLFFNALWSVAFFGVKSPLLGLFVISVLWVLILVTLVKFWRIERMAGLLFVPYILWVSFAAVLNFAVWRLNV